jgi:hypothetical protein
VFEAARLLGQLANRTNSTPYSYISGLGDHVVYGAIFRSNAPSLRRFIGTDSYLPSPDGNHYTLIQARPADNGDTILDVWGMAQIGGGQEHGLNIMGKSQTVGSTNSVEVHFASTAADADAISRLVSDLEKHVEAFSLGPSFRFPREISGAGCKLPHYNDLLKTPGHNRWIPYCCRAGQVHHEYSGSGLAALIGKMGWGDQLSVLGGPSILEIGAYNPTMTYLATTNIVALDIVGRLSSPNRSQP